MRTSSLTSILIGCTLAASLAACNSSSVPHNTASTQSHLYVTGSSGDLYVFQLPLTASSVPTITLAASATGGLVVSQHKLYVPSAGSVIHVYQLPLTASSTPSQTLTTSAYVLSIAADASGTIYAAEDLSTTCCLDVFQSGATSPSFTLTGSDVDDPFGVAVDSSGNVFLANAANIGYFAATVHSGQTGITFGRDDFNEGIVTDSSDNVYVADGDGTGTMDVYHPPYTGATTVASTVTIPGTLFQMTMSSSGTMYIAIGTPNQIDVLTTPYTTVATSVSTAFAAYGVAVGP